MTNLQLYLALGVPLIFNLFLYAAVSARIDNKIEGVEDKIQALGESMNQRFDDMRDLWRAELRRVEEVIDARLKHLEER